MTLVKVGNCGLKATQGGDSTYYYAAPAAYQNFAVTQATQTITFANPGTQTYGTPLTLSATVNSPLTVNYTSTTLPVCTVPVSGSTVTFVKPGSCTIKATVPGNTYYAAATPVTQSFTVKQAAQTITFPTIPATTLVTGSFALSPAPSASSGQPVTIVSSTSSVCTVAGTTVTLVAVGNCGLKATQGGNTDYLAAAAAYQNFAVTLATQSITFPTIPATSLSAGTVTLTATASSGLPVSYSSSTPSVCTVAGSTATLVAVGNCGLKATQGGDGTYYYAALAAYQNFKVTK